MNVHPDRYKCVQCDKVYSSASSLWNHNSKFHKDVVVIGSHNVVIGSPDVVNVEAPSLTICSYCKKNFQNRSNRWRHEKTCNAKALVLAKLDAKNKKENKLVDIKQQNINNNINNTADDQLINTLFEYRKKIEVLQSKLDEKPVEIKKEEIVVKSTSLTLNDVVIISRAEDNYINATQLCQAGGKKFNDWFRLDTTKKLIKVLETNTGIPVLDLIEINVGGIHTGSWIHPDLAIQLAQWISPEFALQVSVWIRQLFVNGYVSIDIKLKEELKNKELEIKIKDEENKILQNKYVKKQKRTNTEVNCIYLVTSAENLKKRVYILGKTSKLKDRLSGYNKTCPYFSDKSEKEAPK